MGRADFDSKPDFNQTPSGKVLLWWDMMRGFIAIAVLALCVLCHGYAPTHITQQGGKLMLLGFWACDSAPSCEASILDWCSGYRYDAPRQAAVFAATDHCAVFRSDLHEGCIVCRHCPLMCASGGCPRKVPGA